MEVWEWRCRVWVLWDRASVMAPLRAALEGMEVGVGGERGGLKGRLKGIFHIFITCPIVCA